MGCDKTLKQNLFITNNFSSCNDMQEPCMYEYILNRRSPEVSPSLRFVTYELKSCCCCCCYSLASLFWDVWLSLLVFILSLWFFVAHIPDVCGYACVTLLWLLREGERRTCMLVCLAVCVLLITLTLM